MAKKEKHMFTSSEIKRVYRLHKKGLTNKEVAEELGVRENAVYTCLNTIKWYWDPELLKKISRRNHAYMRAVYILKGDEPEKLKNNHEAEPKEATQTDSFTKLEKGFFDFQQIILNCIEEVVEKQVGEIKEENKKLMAQVEDLTVIKDKARESNVFGALRKKFMGEEN